MTATLSDPDGVTTTTWVWERSQDNRPPWEEIKEETADSYMPTSTDVGDYLRVTATYTDEHGPDEKTLQQMTDHPVRDAQGNTPPRFSNTTTTLSVPENTAAGRYIARWWAAMESVPTGQSIRIEGIFLITLTERGQCRVFREWWNEDPPATGASEFG